ncbi:MAG: dynamin family protein [Sporomusaceae bacterium]|nr:dynamin family protein [Sporomusaceae bacterium]
MLTAFNYIRDINVKYKLSTEMIEEQMNAYTTQQVAIPVIGKFSAGKTAIINTLLGYRKKLLREDINPETAVPTEIYYKEDMDEVVVRSDNSERIISIEEYMDSVFDFEQINSIALRLDNRFLASVKDVMLVDMPGFDSGYEVHNKAIDEYLPKSLVYLIAFSAEEMTLKYNMVSILKELTLNDMPICIVITKSDKVTSEILEGNLIKLRADIEKHLGKKEIRICITSSKDGEVNELLEFLKAVQANAQAIINKKYKQIINQLVSETETFIQTLVQNQGLTMSELYEQEEALQKELEELQKSLSAQSDSFSRTIPTCVREIEADLLQALQREEASLVAMLMNEQDISERINIILRAAVTQSVKQRFLPKVQRYVEDITSRLNTLVLADLNLTAGQLNIDTNTITSKVVNTAVAAIGVVILGPILALIGGVIAWFVSNKKKEAARQAQKAQISQKLQTDVFPRVIQQIMTQLEIELMRHANEINTQISEELNSRYMTISQALKEVTSQRETKEGEKKRFLLDAQADLEELRGIKYECN